MRKRMRGRRLPSAGVILGALALFISLGSGAVALQVSGIGAKALKKVTERAAGRQQRPEAEPGALLISRRRLAAPSEPGPCRARM